MCNILNLSLFLLAFGCVNSQNELTCYDCDPRNAEECHSPEESNASTQTCGQNTNGTEANNGTFYLCLSSYRKTAKPETTGIIRGCFAVRPDVQDACELLREEISSKNDTMISCHSCNSTRCNTIRLYSDGTSGAESSYFVLMMCVSLIFGIIITSSV